MVILGLSDGDAPGAALVVDDRVVAVEASQGEVPARSRLPFAAADRVLRIAGLTRADVAVVALAGRYTPPLAVRRRPRLRRWATDPFSATRALSTRAERWLRGSGLGAADADRAKDWLTGEVVALGFQPRKVVLVDIHRALASSVYRTSDADRATIVVVHPDGDGVFASVHHAGGGQIDRVLADRATTGVHVFLDRALFTLGVADLGGLVGLAGAAEPDAELRRELGEVVEYRGHFTGRPGPERRRETPWSTLRKNPAVGAATVLAHLREVSIDLVRHHQVDGVVQLAGSWFSDPGSLRLGGTTPFTFAPWRGDAALALGAAADTAGIAARAIGPDLGAPVAPEGDGPESVTPEDAAAAIAAGVPWIRCRDRSAEGALALRNRGVWIRADRPRLVARARELLEVPESTPQVVLRSSRPEGLPADLRDSWWSGVTHGGRTLVGAAGHPVVEARLAALARHGVEEVALLPLARRPQSGGTTLPSVQGLAAKLEGALEWSNRYEPRSR